MPTANTTIAHKRIHICSKRKLDRFELSDTIISNLLSKNPPLLISLAIAGGRTAGHALN
jgi:hypothetical protein